MHRRDRHNRDNLRSVSLELEELKRAHDGCLRFVL
jgi:quinol monooxygenase YgiN